MKQKYHRHNPRTCKALTPPEYPEYLFKHTKHTKSRRSGKFLWLRKRLRFVYLKLLRLRGKPEVVAKGLALGVFAGCFPFFGLQSLLGIFLATIFRGSKVAAMAATWISNPLTYVPLFVFNYKIGKLLLGIEDTVLPTLDLESFTAFKELGATFAIALLTGSFVVGTILAAISYFYSLAILERLRDKRLVAKKSKRTPR